MTNPYSARYKTAFDYFKDAVMENFKKNIEFNDENEKSFKLFYKFIDEKVESDYFLSNSSKHMVEYVDRF
jgi:hypothetical protein